jgi:hypothetical protein
MGSKAYAEQRGRVDDAGAVMKENDRVSRELTPHPRGHRILTTYRP